MSKRHIEDQWQQNGPKFHFILWEHSQDGFVYHPPLTVENVFGDDYDYDNPEPQNVEGPRLCKECDGVMEPWKRSLDLVHCCMRMTAKEGRAFRPEVMHLAALSPQRAIRYTVESFRLYNKRRRKNVLTESTVLAVPVHVLEGVVSSEESGVTVEDLEGVDSAMAWLRSFTQNVRHLADAEHGKAALVVVHEDGVPVVPFGISNPFFKHDKPEIRHVVVILAGSGAATTDLEQLQSACIAEDRCECGPFRLSVPSWRHPHAAIGFLLMQHDRMELMPMLEDLRKCGERKYLEFQDALQDALTCVALSTRKKKAETVQQFSDAVNEQFSDAVDADEVEVETQEEPNPEPVMNGHLTPTPPSKPPPPWLGTMPSRPKPCPEPDMPSRPEPDMPSRPERDMPRPKPRPKPRPEPDLERPATTSVPPAPPPAPPVPPAKAPRLVPPPPAVPKLRPAMVPPPAKAKSEVPAPRHPPEPKHPPKLRPAAKTTEQTQKWKSEKPQVIHTESRVHLPAPKRNGGSNGTRIRPNAVGHFGAVNGSHAKAEGARLNGETAKGPKSASNG